MKSIFLICSVRNANDDQKRKLEAYVANLESQGYHVHYPARDTNQVDATGGYQICSDNGQAIMDADEVHVFWDPNSQGSLFDLGMAFALNKPLIVANLDELEPTQGKSFANMIKYWSTL